MRTLMITTILLISKLDLHADEAVPIVAALEEPGVIDAMRDAWKLTANGTRNFEASFRLDASPSGYDIVSLPLTYQDLKQKVTIVPGTTFAVFHVHPNRGLAVPSHQDQSIAARYNVKIVSMHREGLYEYDPVTRKTTRLRDGLDWLKRVISPSDGRLSTASGPSLASRR